MTWEPILDGELAQRAWVAVHDVADALATVDQPSPDLALFWTYLAAASDDAKTAARTDAAMTKFAREIESGIRGVRLYGGLTGAGWIAGHVADDVEPFLEIVDTALIDALAVEPWTYDYDLIGGLAGMAVYFLDRAGPASSRGLARIVEHLDTLAVTTPKGITWHTAPDLLPEYQRVQSPEGYYNCGLAHGVPGVVAVLGKIAARPDAPAAAARLCDGAISWLLAERDPGGWPAAIDGGARSPTRAAWCYGDPGVLVAMWNANARRGQSTAEIDRFDGWMTRPLKGSGAVDTGLCHGTGGLAHLANRFYQATRNPDYRAAAITWYEHTLEMRNTEPIAGFPQYVPIPEPGEAHWRGTPAFLDGAAGVAMTLLAGLVPIEPEWDRLMLCDLPVHE
ncbi:MAG TPA: lanthionine synthetase C family protein [Kofleriaceae bacterium]|nr:lanthionine synthetase C family protein [Kofleriaceae bacterium]